MKKIIAFTAIRSEYDLLSSLYQLLHKEKNIELKLIVSGCHLSNKYGYSVREIEADGLDILARIETLIDSDTKASRLKSGAMLLQKGIDIVDNYNPDLIMYAGDREEVIMAALIGGYLEIPTMHFFGGDHVKDSHIDNPVRHATSKLSSVHMVSTKEHRKRLIKMGEAPERIFTVGSIALDKFVNEPMISKEEIKKHFNIQNDFNNFALVIFHPIPLERNKTGIIFSNILNALQEKAINAFVSYPNIDPGNKQIIEVIEQYKNNSNFVFYKNLPRNMFVSIFKHAEFIIGNSSAGIVESASLPVPAINVGARQIGRHTNNNVVFSGKNKDDITVAIDKVMSDKFKLEISNMINSYGDGNSAQRALGIIKSHNFKGLIFKNEDILDVV